jgi:hypothetical protein
MDPLELELSNGSRIILKHTKIKYVYMHSKGGIFNCDYPYKDLKEY